jgi:thioredoxin reductase
MIRHLDDTNQVKGYEKAGATVLKGVARIAGPGRVEVDGQAYFADHIVVATGSDAFIPPIPGLDEVTVWTNREATTLTEIPRRAVMIGGSAAGVELGLFLRRYGAHVTILQRSARLLSREESRPGELTEQYLREEGIDVRTSTSAVHARKNGEDTVVELDSGDEVRCDVIVVGTGRTPRAGDLGLESLGIELGERGEVVVDERCRAGEGVWALGDVTGVMPFTHVAMYMGRVMADNISGTKRTARYDGIPRVVFTDPEVAAVGLTTEQAEARGLSHVAAEVNLANAITRTWTYEEDPRGHQDQPGGSSHPPQVRRAAFGTSPSALAGVRPRSDGGATRSHQRPPGGAGTERAHGLGARRWTGDPASVTEKSDLPPLRGPRQAATATHPRHPGRMPARVWREPILSPAGPPGDRHSPVDGGVSRSPPALPQPRRLPRLPAAEERPTARRLHRAGPLREAAGGRSKAHATRRPPRSTGRRSAGPSLALLGSRSLLVPA